MVSPVKGLLLGVFFLSVGMAIDLGVVMDNPLWISLSVIGIGILKSGIIFLLCLLFKFETAVSAETAIMLGQSGEFVFVIVAMALSNGIISIPDAQFFMLVTALSMVITPFVAIAAPPISHLGFQCHAHMEIEKFTRQYCGCEHACRRACARRRRA